MATNLESHDRHLPEPDFRAAGVPCVRCGYALIGIADEMPCPECGLLAERSRHQDGELSNASPRWLLGISLGAGLVLAAHVLAPGWRIGLALVDALATEWRWHRGYYGNYSWLVPPTWGVDAYHIELVGADLAAVILIVGAGLLTVPQQATRSRDVGLRTAIRLASFVPLLAVVALQAHRWANGWQASSDWLPTLILLGLAAFAAPLPAMVFVLLRRLADRVLHPRLAEHATIVGVGFSATLAGIPLLVIAYQIGRAYGDTYWETRSAASLWIVIVGIVAFVLFAGWSALNCLRFVIAFRRAYLGARRKWRDADRREAF